VIFKAKKDKKNKKLISALNKFFKEKQQLCSVLEQQIGILRKIVDFDWKSRKKSFTLSMGT
jgi:hypothetical protein